MAFFGDITLGQFYPGTSFLHSLDPRSKLLASLVLMTCLLFANTIYSLSVHLAFCLLAWRLSLLPAKVLVRNLRPFLWLILITLVIHLFSGDGRILWSLPVVRWNITEAGAINSVIYSVRLLLLISLAAFLTMTTPPTELTDGLEKLFAPLKWLRVPVHELALMITLSLRFIPILIREAERVKNAQISRGASLEGSLSQRIHALVPMIVPLLVLALQRAEELAVAMDSRAYMAGEERTSFRKLGFARRDVATFAVLACLPVVTVVFG